MILYPIQSRAETEVNLLCKGRQRREDAGGYIMASGNTYLRRVMMWEQGDGNKTSKCAVMSSDTHQITMQVGTGAAAAA